MLTCTLLATDDGLALARAEIEAVAAVRCLQVRPLLGDLTHAKVQEACGQPADVLWYAGHMTAEGLPLADGSHLPPAVIGAYVAAFEFRLAFLNSCTGSEAAQAIYMLAGRCSVIFHKSEIEDASAYHLAGLVAQQLCLGGIGAALRFARSVGYEVLQGAMSYQFPQGQPEFMQVVYDVRERMVRMEEKMVRMEEDVRLLRCQQPQNLSGKQLVAMALGIFMALLLLAAVVFVLAGRWP